MPNPNAIKYDKPISMRADREFLAAIGELMRHDTSHERPPSMSEVIRKLVFEARDRIRKGQRK